MACRYTLSRRVEFADTDSAGIMHFSNYFRFMEVVEHSFFRSLGFSVAPEAGDGDAPLLWPRVHASCDFRLPLRFEQEVEIELLVEKIRGKSIRYRFHFWKAGTSGERVLAAEGRTSVVPVCLAADGQSMRALEIPQMYRDKIEAASPEMLEKPGAD
ncbi:MAG: acyl-CoA thioesterase [Verrucomicrobiales bacterium]